MHITYAMVKDDLPGIIAQRGGDFQYETHPGSGGTCMYVWDGQPDCLIGCYLADLGLPLEAFEAIEGSGIDSGFDNGHLEKYGFTAEREAITAMERIQNLQDNEYTWGDAYDRIFDSEH